MEKSSSRKKEHIDIAAILDVLKIFSPNSIDGLREMAQEKGW